MQTSLMIVAVGLLLPAMAAAQDVPAPMEPGGVPGPSLVKSFLGEFVGTATHREDVRLDVGGESGQSMRMALNLQWRLQTPRTGLRASLGPYFEMFSEGDLSTYGGSAGLGLDHQSSPVLVWNVRATVVAVPEQDVQPPQVEDQPPAASFATLVPRNGFVATTAGGGVTRDISTNSSFSLSANVSRTEYDAFDVDDGSPSPTGLADQDTISLSTGFNQRLNAARAWSVQVSASRTSLSGGATLPEDSTDDRDQVSVTGGISQRFSAQTLSVQAGLSQVDTGELGTEGTFVFDGTWSWAGQRSGVGVVLRRSQGVFAAERASANATSIASTVNWQLRRGSSVNLSGGYGISERSSGGAGDVRTRSVSASYRWQGQLLGWSASVSTGRQRSDADFGRDQDTTNLSLSLNWRFAGAGRAI